jgi:uncharacterized OB-fold protein
MKQTAGLELQVCGDCGHVQYPERELCAACLGDTLTMQPVSSQGRLLSTTAIHASVEPFFQARGPWPVASVKLAAGPVAIAHLASHHASIGQTVELIRMQDPDGRSVLVAWTAGEPAPEADRLFGAVSS